MAPITPISDPALGWALPQARAIAAAWVPHAGRRIALGPACDAQGLAAIQAVLLAGCTAVLINRRLPPAQVREQLERAGVAAAFACEGHPLRALGALAIPVGDPTACRAHHPEGALVLFTSGTTGVPKMARITAAALLASAHAGCTALGVGRGDTWLACLPPDHIAGAMIALRSAVSGCAVIAHAASVEAVAADLAQASVTSLVPTQLARLLDAGACGIRTALVGGAPLDPLLQARAVAAGFGVRTSYGLTEAASTVAIDGIPVPGMRVACDGGVIAIDGPGLFAGYEADGGRLRPRMAGAFVTGDLGSFDGHRLTVHARREDLILSGGENVYPAVVEAALLAHPRIADAAVYGRADAQWGQQVRAACVARGAPPDAAELDAFLRARLSGPQLPRRIAWLDALPRSPLGKLLRGDLP